MRIALALCAALVAGSAQAEILSAQYVDPTDIYGHGAIEGGEYAALEVTTDLGVQRITWQGAVYEDTTPRLVDLDGDGNPEVVTVLSGFQVGASIQIFGERDGRVSPLAQTAPIGRSNRWLAIAGIADLDGDGVQEIAYVDRPHLAKTLRVISVQRVGDAWHLTDVAAREGLTNHKLGAPDIEGGIYDCGNGLEIFTADARWQRVIATRLEGRALLSRDIGPYRGAESLTCP